MDHLRAEYSRKRINLIEHGRVTRMAEAWEPGGGKINRMLNFNLTFQPGVADIIRRVLVNFDN